MNDELERLRDVVRALVAESQAWTAFYSRMVSRMGKGLTPTEESIREAHRISGIVEDRKRDLDQAMARLAEVNPELVAGYQPKGSGSPTTDGGSDPMPDPPAG
jgi:hypothetical protein